MATAAEAAAYRAANLDPVRARDRARNGQKHRLIARSEYQKTPAGKAKHAAANKLYRERNALKYKAHCAVNNAIRDGKLHRLPCEHVCEDGARCGRHESEAHHDDYAKPLVVRWLCDEHHKQWHMENK